MTLREQVLELRKAGMKPREIAEKLGCAVTTVRTYSRELTEDEIAKRKEYMRNYTRIVTPEQKEKYKRTRRRRNQKLREQAKEVVEVIKEVSIFTEQEEKMFLAFKEFLRLYQESLDT